MIRLLVADDHAILRDGIKQLVSGTSDIEVVAEAANGEEIRDCLDRNNFDLILLDLSMPGIDGVELIAQLKSHWPGLPILVFSGHIETGMAVVAIKAGASGYVTKDSSPATLLQAIRKVASGGQFMDPEIAEQVVFGMLKPQQSLPHMRLSRRELEIFLLLAKGNSVNAIAERLSISNKTVSSHKTHLMVKMNLSSNANLVHYALEHRLIHY